MKQNDDTWLEWRRSGIGSSDAPAILGVCPYRTIADVYREKKNGTQQYAHPGMLRGKRLEPVARAEYERTAGLVVQPATRVHPAIDWMRASLDGIAFDDDHLVEIKVPSDGTFAKLREERTCPAHYQAQIQHQLAVTGARTADLWVWHPDHEGLRIPVARDEDYIARLIEAEGQFWAMVLDGVPPPDPALGEERTDGPWLDAAREYVRAEAVVAEWRGRQDAARELLVSMMGDAVRVRGGGVSLTQITSKGKVNYKRVPQLEGVNLDAYRGPTLNTVRVTVMEG